MSGKRRVIATSCGYGGRGVDSVSDLHMPSINIIGTQVYCWNLKITLEARRFD